jgi:hypothetical protein
MDIYIRMEWQVEVSAHVGWGCDHFILGKGKDCRGGCRRIKCIFLAQDKSRRQLGKLLQKAPILQEVESRAGLGTE